MNFREKSMTALSAVLFAASVTCPAANAQVVTKDGAIERKTGIVRILSSTEDILALSLDQWTLLRLVEAENREFTENLLVHLRLVQDAVTERVLASGEPPKGRLAELLLHLAGELALVQLNTEVKIRQILMPDQVARRPFLRQQTPTFSRAEGFGE